MAIISENHSSCVISQASFISYVRMNFFAFLSVILTLMLGFHSDSYAQNYLKTRGGLLPVEENEKWGYIDLKGKLAIPFKFDDARSFAEGLAPVMVGKEVVKTDARVDLGKWGYIDRKGDFIIQPTFNFCDVFSEGMAEVWLDGKHGYVDRSGKLAIEPQFFHTEKFQGGLAMVIRKQNGPKEFIDRSGKTVFTIENIEGMGVSVGNFYDGHATVFYWYTKDRQQDKYGYVNSSGKVTLLPYRTTDDFREGLASVFDGDKNGFINTNYDLVIPVKYDDAKVFSEGLAPVQIGEKYGYIDRAGKLVIPPKFEDAEPFSEGLAAVANEEGKWGFIDKKGKLVIDFKFEDDVSPFVEGIAEVLVGDEISYLFGYINTNGQFIWENKKFLRNRSQISNL